MKTCDTLGNVIGDLFLPKDDDDSTITTINSTESFKSIKSIITAFNNMSDDFPPPPPPSPPPGATFVGIGSDSSIKKRGRDYDALSGENSLKQPKQDGVCVTLDKIYEKSPENVGDFATSILSEISSKFNDDTSHDNMLMGMVITPGEEEPDVSQLPPDNYSQEQFGGGKRKSKGSRKSKRSKKSRKSNKSKKIRKSNKSKKIRKSNKPKKSRKSKKSGK